jgi:poly-gamma-glutamate synthesis protein (capsule biosynthesis protein)
VKKIFVFFVLIFTFGFSACTPPQEIKRVNDTPSPQITQSIIQMLTPTAFLPNFDELDSKNGIGVWFPEYLSDIQIKSEENEGLFLTEDKFDADCYVGFGNNEEILGDYTYALTVPFNTVQDDISAENIKNLLLKNSIETDFADRIFLSENTNILLSEFLGELSDIVEVVPEEEIFTNVNNNAGSYGIIRFDYLEPKWKVIRIDNISPIDKNFDEKNYLLNFPIHVNCLDAQDTELVIKNIDKFSTRNEDKISYVLMTGTTALTRATAHQMENFGIHFPGEKIKNWFENSDIRHISSETPFFDNCPYPDPIQKNLVFCSNPKYVELFKSLGVNVIELTGNHLLDKGVQPFENTLLLYQQSGIDYFAGGFSINEAKDPLLIEHNGNKIAFLGCNMAGPANVWATDSKSGVNFCDLSEMKDQIFNLVNEGFLPIFTFQYYESNSMKPAASQVNDFREMVIAGAVIVSGSQSHVPMTMEIYNGDFIHYGLGNLFFDQMDNINNRREFIDRHIFYDGKYIGTELLTAMLENYAQPRPMTEIERKGLLQDAFRDFRIEVEGY